MDLALVLGNTRTKVTIALKLAKVEITGWAVLASESYERVAEWEEQRRILEYQQNLLVNTQSSGVQFYTTEMEPTIIAANKAQSFVDTAKENKVYARFLDRHLKYHGNNMSPTSPSLPYPPRPSSPFPNAMPMSSLVLLNVANPPAAPQPEPRESQRCTPPPPGTDSLQALGITFNRHPQRSTSFFNPLQPAAKIAAKAADSTGYDKDETESKKNSLTADVNQDTEMD